MFADSKLHTFFLWARELEKRQILAEQDPVRHVVIVTDSLEVDGGSGRVALDSARALAARGIRTTVFAANGTAQGDAPNLRFISTGQGLFLEDPSRIAAAVRGLYNARARDQLASLLTECDPRHTIVHVHGWTKALSASIFEAIGKAEIPLVMTLHEYFLACPTGSLYLHKDRDLCGLKPMGVRCITKDCDSRSYAFKAYRVARQLLQNRIDAAPIARARLLTVSEFSKNILLPMMPRGTQIEVLRNPISIELAPRAEAEKNATFLYVGRLSAEKGAALFAESARKAGVEAIFLGEGEQRAEIRRINPDARLIGWVDPAEVSGYMRTARSIVVPSLWYETFGLVVMEGAAVGVPAIVPSGTAPSEIVDDGQTGSWFARGDCDDLADRLRMHRDDSLIERLSGNAYDAFWSNPATMAKHVDDALRIYRTVQAETFAR